MRITIARALLVLVVGLAPRAATAKELSTTEITLQAKQFRRIPEAGWNALRSLSDGDELTLPGGVVRVAMDGTKITFTDTKSDASWSGRSSKGGSVVKLKGLGADGADFAILVLRHPKFDVSLVVNANALRATVGRATVAFVDANLNGRHGDPKGDAILLDERGPIRLLPHTSIVPIAGRSMSLRVADSAAVAAVTAEEVDTGLTADELEALTRLNEYRLAAGLEEVPLDDAMCAGARLHCEYMQRNMDEFGHFETKGRPGYSAEGDNAARKGCLARGRSIANCMDGFVATLYHRFPLLSYRATGIGLARRGTSVVAAPNIDRSVRKRILFPAPGQFDVSVLYDAGETQCPKAGAGFPITIRGPLIRRTTKAEATLRVAGKRGTVGCNVTWPGNPALVDRPVNRECIMILPDTSLKANTEYLVRLVWTRGKDVETLEWRFFTGADRPYR